MIRRALLLAVVLATAAAGISVAAEDGSFEHQVALGTGRNEVNISVVDEQGYPTKLNLVVHVDDSEPPQTDLSARRDGRWVVLDGTVRDNVQVGAVHAAGQSVQIRSGKIDVTTNSVELDQTVPYRGGENVTVVVRDRAGNRQTVHVPIGDDSATPTPTATPSPTPTATPTPTPTPSNTTMTATATARPTTTSTLTPAPTPTNTDSGPSPLLIAGGVVVGAWVLLAVGGGL